MSYKEKYLKYKNKYLSLRKQLGGVRDDNLLYKKYIYLQLSDSDLTSAIDDIKSEELNREIENFVKIYYLEDPQMGSPVLLSMNPDIYGEEMLPPSISEELKIKIKKVHLLYQALKTGNKIFFLLINHYWSKFKNPPNILDIWKTLPDNYKSKYDLIYESIRQGFIDIFEYLCGAATVNKNLYYKDLRLFKIIYEQALYLLKNNVIKDYFLKTHLLEKLFYYLLPYKKEETNYGISKEMNDLCIYIHTLHKEILDTGAFSIVPPDYFNIPSDISDKIFRPKI